MWALGLEGELKMEDYLIYDLIFYHRGQVDAVSAVREQDQFRIFEGVDVPFGKGIVLQPVVRIFDPCPAMVCAGEGGDGSYSCQRRRRRAVRIHGDNPDVSVGQEEGIGVQ